MPIKNSKALAAYLYISSLVHLNFLFFFSTLLVLVASCLQELSQLPGFPTYICTYAQCCCSSQVQQFLLSITISILLCNLDITATYVHMLVGFMNIYIYIYCVAVLHPSDKCWSNLHCPPACEKEKETCPVSGIVDQEDSKSLYLC